MNPSNEFNRLYSDVSASIASAMEDISDLKVDHKQGKVELSNVMERLRVIRGRFDDELGLLERNAEWDKFTIAFFGETNAGKSTILESLRILFNEGSRQQLLRENSSVIEKYEQALEGHVDNVREGIRRIYTEYVDEIESINVSAAALRGILSQESSERIKNKVLLASAGGVIFGFAVCGALVHFMGS